MIRLPDWARPLILGLVVFVLMVLSAPVWRGYGIGGVAFIAGLSALLGWFAVNVIARRR